MRVVLVTKGRCAPAKGGRVRVDGLVYVVTSAEEPTELDDVTSVTEAEIQPAGAVPGIPTLPARLLCRAD